MTDDLNAFLAHYGVNGMRWGVRKSRNEVDRAKPPEDREKPTVLKQALDILKTKFASTSYSEMKKHQLDKTQEQALDDSIQETQDQGGDVTDA